jgi:UDP:flavonoid glycosyltransferase YjiC (YdhE family)
MEGRLSDECETSAWFGGCGARSRMPGRGVEYVRGGLVRWSNVVMRVLCSVMPFAGHVAPFTGLVTELVGRGHQVSVLTGSQYVSRFAALGAVGSGWRSATDFDERDLTASFPQLGRGGPLGVLANINHLFIGTAAGQARDLLELAAGQRPDVTVGDVWSLGAGLAVDLRGLPWATFAITPLALSRHDLPPVGFGLAPGRGRLGRARDSLLRGVFSTITAPLNQRFGMVCRQLGVTTRTLEQAQHSPYLVLATGCPALEPPRSDLPDQIHFVGRVRPAARRHGENPPRIADRPLVVITQGTFDNNLTRLALPAMEALRDLPLDVIITGDPASIPPSVGVPPNTKVVPFLDFEAVLPQTSVLVTNGGWGGVLAALRRVPR